MTDCASENFGIKKRQRRKLARKSLRIRRTQRTHTTGSEGNARTIADDQRGECGSRRVLLYQISEGHPYASPPRPPYEAVRARRGGLIASSSAVGRITSSDVKGQNRACSRGGRSRDCCRPSRCAFEVTLHPRLLHFKIFDEEKEPRSLCRKDCPRRENPKLEPHSTSAARGMKYSLLP